MKKRMLLVVAMGCKLGSVVLAAAPSQWRRVVTPQLVAKLSGVAAVVALLLHLVDRAKDARIAQIDADEKRDLAMVDRLKEFFAQQKVKPTATSKRVTSEPN